VGYVLDRESGRRAETGGTGPGAKTSFRHGDGASRVLDVEILNREGVPCRAFQNGQPMTIRVRAEFYKAVDNPVVGILIRNRIGMDVFGTNTRVEQMHLGRFEPSELVEVEFELDCLLSRQEYTLTVATQYSDGLSQDWLDEVLDFRVVDTKDIAGVLNLNARVHYRKVVLTV
jgi:hypothetical protein